MKWQFKEEHTLGDISWQSHGFYQINFVYYALISLIKVIYVISRINYCVRSVISIVSNRIGNVVVVVYVRKLLQLVDSTRSDVLRN